MKNGDYIIATKTIRGECKIDRRYKILGIDEKGKNISFIEDFPLILDSDHYFIIHNNTMTISSCENFKYDYVYNRKRKMNQLKKK